MKVIKYNESYKEIWDLFVSKAKNTHFFFYRDYMEYHKDRFEDFSLMFWDDKNKLIAIMPASVKDNVVTSHGGLTFGGILSDKKMTASIMLVIFDTIKEFLLENNIKELVYKPLPYIYHKYPAQEDLYALFRNGAELFRRDISSVILLPERYAYSKGRKWMCSKGRKNRIEVEESTDFDSFISLENYVLNKYHNTVAVHLPSELKMLAERFPNNIKLFLGKKDNNILSGAVVFENENIVHVQYMANSDKGREYGALDVVIDKLITEVYSNRIYFDFGMSNENMGTYLNEGLIHQKEGFGGRGVVYDFYKIRMGGENEKY
ncbi:MAG: hypothetical protein U0K23_04225 [Selenomonadaceae bacterium]|nr:hypothetical protein [Selenomonadaceae bacterium]